jgi:hypothetical protein
MTRSSDSVPPLGQAASALGGWVPPQGSAQGYGLLHRLWHFMLESFALTGLKRQDRRLRIKETISLGDKRFVSILEVDGQSVLIGGGAGHVSLLARLPGAGETFQQVLSETGRVPGAR